MFTYRKLLMALNELPERQLDMTVSLFIKEVDEIVSIDDMVIASSIADAYPHVVSDSVDTVDEDQPLLVME